MFALEPLLEPVARTRRRPARAPDETIEQLLEHGRAALGMDAAFLVAFEDGGENVRFVEGDGERFGLPDKDGGRLARHARRVAEGVSPGLAADLSSDGGLEERILWHEGVGASVCVGLQGSDGRLLGAMCGVASEPDPVLDQEDLAFLRPLAFAVAEQLEREELERELDRVEGDRIRDVIGGHGLDIVFQPVFDLARDEVIAYEALSRFRSEPYRSPPVWFAEANDVGLGIDLELTAVEAALQQLDDLPPDVRLAFNVSPTTAASPELFYILELVGDRVIVELTEHDPVDDYDALKAAVHSLRGLGALIAVDDAGTGFSTFERILRLEPDIVKVDLRLARDVVGDPTRRALVAALIFFASSISATIVAEGIETQSELELVRRLKMAYGQGSWLGVPGPFPSVSELSVRR